MKKYFKFLKWFIISIIITCIIVTISVIIIDNANTKGFVKINSNEFYKIALEKKISTFTKDDDIYKMALSVNEKYATEFNVNDSLDQNSFQEKIIENLKSFSVAQEYRYSNDFDIIYGTFLTLLIISLSLFWIITFADLLKSEFIVNQNKWIWLVIFILFSPLAPFLYYNISINQKKSI